MKELVLFRHAKASRKAPSGRDLDRPLSRRGRKAAARMAKWLAKAGYRPDVVLCSTAIRTRETLDFMKDALGNAKVHFEGDLYLSPADGLLERLRNLPGEADSVLLVGHNPGLQDLALQLIGGRAAKERVRIQTKFPTAALVRFKIDADTWRDLGPKTARVVDCVYPRALEP
jgi:phosphohistidine phosphatase